MSLIRAAASGLIGACALTLIHESARQVIPSAPRMDILGKRAIAKSMRWLDREPPAEDRLHNITLAGDIISNSAYYSLIGLGKPEGALLRGAILGLAAGVGGVLLPEPLGLGNAPSARTPQTKAMTVAWYLAGGIVAALTYRALSK
jgi:hypothetical protein